MFRDATLILVIATLLLAGAVASLAAEPAPGTPAPGNKPGEAPAAPAWNTNYEQALKAAKESGKPILARFTGSDWNGMCIRQEQEVFSSAEFKEWAAKNVVLLVVDFPTRKGQDDATKAQNQELKKKFDVKSYPTVVFISGDGKETARLAGYKPGTGSKKWVESATAATAKK